MALTTALIVGPNNAAIVGPNDTTLENAIADSDDSFKLLDAARLVSGQHSSFQI